MNLRGVALLALAAASPAAAFTSPPAGAGLGVGQRQTGGALTTVLGAAGRVPVLEEWKILRNGAANGIVRNHPTLPDGDVITTSPLSDPKASADGAVVTTKSGSKYKLGGSKGGAGAKKAAAPAAAKNPFARPGVTKAAPPPKKAAAPAAKKKSPFGSFGSPARKAAAPPKAAEPAAKAAAPPAKKSLFGAFGGGGAAKPAPKKAAPKPAPAKRAPAPKKAAPVAKKAAAPAAATAESTFPMRLRQAKIDFGLSGKTAGPNGKYLLSGKPMRSTSGKSQIFTAYRADAEGLPAGETVTIKISPNFAALTRENKNYDRVTGGLFSGRFVKKIEFLENAGPDFGTQCALVLETGKKNLRNVLSARMNGGLSGKAMRNAASSAAQCIQAMHTSNLVWTDLKAENFVVLPDTSDMTGMVGIDLESAIPHRGNPVDYSPEACPPEFADALLAGMGPEFVLDYSYDVWSYGMLLYELNVGKGYFAGRNAAAITKMIRAEGFVPDLKAVKDGKLQDLIRQCLQIEPKKRPGFAQILLHPYFVTTGFGPFSF